MDKKLREFAELIRSTKGLPDKERFLALMRFVTKRDRARAWYNQLTVEQKGLWGEARYCVNSYLQRAYDALSMSTEEKLLNFPKGDYPFKWDELEGFVDELAGTAPNRSTERWMAGIKNRLLVSLRRNGSPWTKAHAKECCKGLLEFNGAYEKEFKALAVWAIEQGI